MLNLNARKDMKQRLGKIRLALACIVAPLLSAGAALADWRPSLFDRQRAIQACATKVTEDAWACAFVLCEPNRGLKLYIDVPGVLSDGPIRLAINNRDYRLTLAFSPNPFGGAHQVVGVDAAFFAAMATGSLLRIRQAGIKPDYDAISLKGFAPALARLSTSCGTKR